MSDELTRKERTILDNLRRVGGKGTICEIAERWTLDSGETRPVKGSCSKHVNKLVKYGLVTRTRADSISRGDDVVEIVAALAAKGPTNE